MASKNGSALILKRPLVDKTQAAELARQLFGFHVSSPKLVKELVSYDDRNFYLKGTFKLPEETRNSEDPATNDAAKPAKEEEFVLKVLNRIDSALNGLVDAQNEMMLFLNQNGVECSCPVKSLDGNYNVMWKNNIRGVAGVHTESVRLLKFVPGKLLRVVPCSPNLLGDLGRFVANFSKVLKPFYHPALEERVYYWDLQHIDLVKEIIFSPKTNDDETRKLLQHVYVRFSEEVMSCVSSLEKQVIHGDLNECNILVAEDSAGDRGYHISGILDFGDVTYSYRLFEIGICMAYLIITMCEAGVGCVDAIHAVRHMLAGYQEVWPLSPAELGFLYWTVAARTCQSLAIGLNQSAQEPDNLYLQEGLDAKKEILKYYVAIPKEELMQIWTPQYSA